MNTCYEPAALLVGGEVLEQGCLQQEWKSPNVISTTLLVKTCCLTKPRVGKGGDFSGHVCRDRMIVTRDLEGAALSFSFVLIID